MSRRWLGCLVMLLLLCSGRSALAAESETEAVTPSTFVAGHLWLTLLDPGAGPRPEATLKQMTSSAKLNDLFQRFKVKLFRPVMPFARTPALRKVHEVVCRCDQFLLMKALQQEAPELVGKISGLRVPHALYDPADYMWSSHSQDWLWYLEKIEADRAWDITRGRGDIKIAVIDTRFDGAHPDLATKLNPAYDPYTGVLHTTYSGGGQAGHGTAVASCAVAETTEIGKTAHGQLSAIGFNTGLLAYTWDNGLAKALHASTVMGADIISISWFDSCSPDTTGYEKMVIKEILDNGTTIVASAGNGTQHCGGKNLFPFSATYDDRIIVVTGTDRDDKHDHGSATQSHYPEVDIAAPGHDIMVATPSLNNAWPYFGSAGGTSFATPIVAGIVGLMRSVNRCLPPAKIESLLKSTADPIADASSFPGQVGAGRVNAHRAVLAALRTYTDFAINGHRSQEMQACHGEKLRLQGCTATLPFQTGPCLADSYFVSVQLSDPWWNRHGPEIMHWLSADEIADICDFDLREFVKGSGLSLTPGSYYRVKLAVGPEWQETSRLVHLEPGKSVLMINGQSTDSVEVTAGEPIFLDGCASRCAKDYFVSVQLSDLWWNRYGQEIQKWLTPEEAQDICHFDLKQFLQGTGLSWNSGNYYRVKLAVSDPWSEKSILVHVK